MLSANRLSTGHDLCNCIAILLVTVWLLTTLNCTAQDPSSRYVVKMQISSTFTGNGRYIRTDSGPYNSSAEHAFA